MEPTSSTARIEELLTHADWVRALARNLSRDDADADDLAQETWLAALGGAPRQPGPAWLGGVARNLSRMRWRSAARRDRREEVAASERAAPPAPDDVVARLEMQRLLADAVLRLDEPWRSTVVQRYLDGLTSAEIARQEGVPAATVRGRLKTGLERLRKDLDERHDGRRDTWVVGLAPVLGLSASEARGLAASASAGSGAAPLALGLLGALVLGTGLLVFAFRGAGGDAPAPPAEPAPQTAPRGAPVPPVADRPDAIAQPEGEQERSDGQGSEPTPEPSPVRVAVPQAFPHVGTPAGMVYVPGGRAIIGTTPGRLGSLLAGRADQVKRDFAFESPRHHVEMPPFFLDRTEVTNAQYLLFLQDTARVVYATDAGALADLEAVTGHLGGTPRDRWDDDDIAWAQLYESHREQLWKKMPDALVRTPAGEVDIEATKAAFRHALLARGMQLVFYDRKPPEGWPSMEPLETRLDHPVMSVSYDDAEAFAEWAGKHIPTEEEWEYAARGPAGHVYPWGDEWFVDLERANWGAKHTDDRYRPSTMPVGTLPAGRSWCGAHHLLGNAGEWTSSWFGPYPGNDREHVSMGEYVKVIRGATFVDLEPLVLRLAARNFIGQGIKAPPRPGNRFGYIGFRCAWFEQPGLDQLGPILRRVSRGRRVTQDTVQLDRYAAAAATRFAPPDAEVEHHVSVQGKAHAIVLIPLTSMFSPDRRTPRIRSRSDLESVTAKTDDPLPLAVFHTDVPLEGVHVRRPMTAAEAERRRRSRRVEPPPMQAGTCPPGTYVLGVWHSRLCLCTDSLEFVCFLTEDEAPPARLDIVGIAPGEVEAARLDLDAEAGVISLSFDVQVGGANAQEETTIVVNGLTLTPQADALSAAGTWRTHSRSDD